MSTIEDVNATQAEAQWDGKTRETIASLLQVLTQDERLALLKLNPWKSWWSILTNWILIFGAMALVAWAWPNPWLTPPAVVVALFVIGCRQLACAVIMHDASHRSMFRNAALNDWTAKWLAAYPVWVTLESYRRQHLRHHVKTWTEDDPDVGLVLPSRVPRGPAARHRHAGTHTGGGLTHGTYHE